MLDRFAYAKKVRMATVRTSVLVQPIYRVESHSLPCLTPQKRAGPLFRWL